MQRNAPSAGVYPEVIRMTLQRKPGQPLGISLSEIYGSGNEGYGLDKAYLVVNTVLAGSPAESAGIRLMDTVLTVNGEMVFRLDQLLEICRDKNKIDLVVTRMMDNSKVGGV
jgi:S1-C subfamily serine protease